MHDAGDPEILVSVWRALERTHFQRYLDGEVILLITLATTGAALVFLASPPRPPSPPTRRLENLLAPTGLSHPGPWGPPETYEPLPFR